MVETREVQVRDYSEINRLNGLLHQKDLEITRLVNRPKEVVHEKVIDHSEVSRLSSLV